MGNPFRNNIIQCGIKIPLSINVQFLVIRDIVNEINNDFDTHFEFSLYNGFFNPSTKNEITITSANQKEYLDEREIIALQVIQDNIKEFTLLSNVFLTSFYFGGVFIYIEKLV